MGRELRQAIVELAPAMREDLELLVRIPSVAFDGFDPAPVRRSAEATAEILASAGLGGVRLIELPGDHPAVFGRLDGPAGSPTVLLYAHHDVQPSGPEDLWDTPPFEPVEKNGRLFGRGTADDKSGIAIHAAVLRAFEGRPPVTVKVIVEGEEEASTQNLPNLVRGNHELLEADVIVVADSGNWRTGEPTLTTTIRGVVDCLVEVRTMELPVHSGTYGGAAPDALMALVRMLASLQDDHGSVAVAGLDSRPWHGVAYPEDAFRTEAGLLPGVELVGEGPLSERLWTKPSVNVIGIDAPSVHGSRNILVDRARARVSLRIPPSEDPNHALDLLTAHLEAAAPWGAHVRVTRGNPARGFAVPTGGPAHREARAALAEAYGRDVVEMGSGGSVPLIPVLMETFPDAELLLLGAMDDRSNIHAQNESVDLAELERAALGQALLLERLATAGG
ncbi:MAG TPA: dipeptidase [Actinomycetota bacterium]|jgi:acetylornithine deacetylase/succinyl-diaminopimelate desuccinylase-like protein|nr:dipeptidase [Actinomycetota bacterium]